MERLRAVKTEVLQRVLLHDVEHDERGNAGRIRRKFGNRPAAIGRGDRRHPFGLKVRQIGRRHGAALLFRQLKDRLSDRSAIESVTAFVRDQLVRLRQIGILEHFSCARRPPVDQVCFGRIGMLRQLVRRSRPATRNDLTHGESVFRVINRWSQDLGKRLCPESRAQRIPTGDRAGHSDRVNSASRHAGLTFGLQ